MIAKYLWIFFISMVPIVELRGAIPVSQGLGLPMVTSYIICILGNMLPVPFIIVYIKRIFEWMRNNMPRMNALITKLENRANLKGETVEKYGHWGLLIFVAIPLPGTGAWTGALIAALLNIRTAKAVPVILIGVSIAAAIMTLITYGVIHIVL